MTWHALPSRSTNVALGAPRLSASMPAAPLPANRSRNGPVERAACLERAEERLLDPVGQRPRALRRRLEPNAARGARDDAAGVRHLRPLSRTSPAPTPLEPASA